MHSLDPHIISQIARTKCRLVIICDTGSSAKDREILALLRVHGYTTVVIDHHNWEGDYTASTERGLIFNSHEERELLRGHEVSGAYASLLVASYLCEKYFSHSLSYNAMVYALASMYADCVDMSTPPGRALYNTVTVLKMPGPQLLSAMNKYNYRYSKRFFSWIVNPKINACFRTEQFGPVNRALTFKDRYEIQSIVGEFQAVHSESVRLVDAFTPLFQRERFGNIVLCTHKSTVETRALHIRNFSGRVAQKIANEEKAMTIAVIKTNSIYEGSYRDYFQRNMLKTFKLFCNADGHGPAFGLSFNSYDYIVRHLKHLADILSAGDISQDILLSSNLVKTKEDVNALALYNEYMNTNPRVIINHRCPYVRLLRSTQYRKTYDVGLPYHVSSTLPLLDGMGIQLDPCLTSGVELRCLE